MRGFTAYQHLTPACMKLFNEIQYQRDVLVSRVAHVRDISKDVFILLIIALVAIGAFLLGRISAAETLKKQNLRILHAGESAMQTNKEKRPQSGSVPTINLTASAGHYVGSISGTTFHLPWCSGAKRIREENKVWFATKAEAIGKGYKAAANCKGI